MKIVIVLVLLTIVASLVNALYHLIKDKGQNQKTVKALTFRIIISLVLFMTIIVASQFGLIPANPRPW